MSKELCIKAEFQYMEAMAQCIWQARSHCVWFYNKRWIADSFIHDSVVYKRIA